MCQNCFTYGRKVFGSEVASCQFCKKYFCSKCKTFVSGAPCCDVQIPDIIMTEIAEMKKKMAEWMIEWCKLINIKRFVLKILDLFRCSLPSRTPESQGSLPPSEAALLPSSSFLLETLHTFHDLLYVLHISAHFLISHLLFWKIANS